MLKPSQPKAEQPTPLPAAAARQLFREHIEPLFAQVKWLHRSELCDLRNGGIRSPASEDAVLYETERIAALAAALAQLQYQDDRLPPDASRFFREVRRYLAPGEDAAPEPPKEEPADAALLLKSPVPSSPNPGEQALLHRFAWVAKTFAVAQARMLQPLEEP